MSTERQRGYNEAKNHHSNGHTLDNWERQIEVAKDFGDYSEFDRGVEDYIKEINTDKPLPLNIFHMHLVAEMHSKMSSTAFKAFINRFNKLLETNRPDEAQKLINRMVNEFTGYVG